MVVTVLSACCLLFGFKETWEDAKKLLLGDMKFLEKLCDYDVTKVPEKRFLTLRNTYLKDENFKKENVLKVSEAAASIYTWVTAIDSFQKVKKIVGPKEAALAEALATL
jgi:dynein heavy chain